MKRYTLGVTDEGTLAEAVWPGGEWVRYDDVEPLLEALREIAEAHDSNKLALDARKALEKWGRK